MSTRRAKQLVYGAFYLVAWLCIFAIFYFAVKLFSGGTVVPPCTPNCISTSTQPLAVQGSIQTFVTSPDHYTFLAEVANVNDDVAAQSFNYTLDVYADASDTILESLPGQSFIYADQVKYIVFPNEMIAGTIDHVALGIQNTAWVPSSTLGIAPQFTFQNLATSAASTTISVGGQITNGSIASYGNVVIVALFKGQNSDPIGVSQTEIDSIGPGETTDFSVIYPATPGINPEENQLFAYAIRE